MPYLTHGYGCVPSNNTHSLRRISNLIFFPSMGGTNTEKWWLRKDLVEIFPLTRRSAVTLPSPRYRENQL